MQPASSLNLLKKSFIYSEESCLGLSYIGSGIWKLGQGEENPNKSKLEFYER